MMIPRWIKTGATILPWIAASVCLAWLILLRIPPSGAASYSFIFDGTHPWLDPFLPAERVTPAGPQSGGWTGQRILRDPVYASARAPGLFDQVRLTLEAKTDHQPFLEFGLLRDPVTFSFDLHPFWSEALSQGWHHVSVSSTQGYVKDGLPDETLVTAKDGERLTWDATTTPSNFMDPAGADRAYGVSLVGSHDFYFIPTQKNMQIVFRLEDAAENRTGLVAELHIYHNGRELGWMKAEPKPDQTIYDETINFKDGIASAGVLRVQIITDDRVEITQVTTPAFHWVVGPVVTIGNVATSTLWTNSQHLVAETLHDEGLQTLRLGSATATLEKTHASVRLNRAEKETGGARQVVAPEGNVRIVGDAFFAVDPSKLFYPRLRRLTDATNLDREGIKAVVTPYIQPETTVDGWKKLTVAFGGLSGDQFKFTLSAPGMESRGGSVDVRAVDLAYQRTAGKSFWTILRDELSLIRQRL